MLIALFVVSQMVYTVGSVVGARTHIDGLLPQYGKVGFQSINQRFSPFTDTLFADLLCSNHSEIFSKVRSLILEVPLKRKSYENN